MSVKFVPQLPRRTSVLPSTLAPNFPHRRGWRRQANVAFFLSLAVYVLTALWLAFDVHYVFGDALARTQSALSVLHSRDPNLSAMGFIFTPLITVLQLPLVAFQPFFSGITVTGFAGAFISALFMAGSVRELWLIASERNVRYWFAVAGTMLYAFNPMIVLYGAVGMSESSFIFASLWAVRRMIRWTSTDDVHDLIIAGFALALAFLARYDAVVMAFISVIGVGAYTWRARNRRLFGDRLGFAVVDMLVLVWPIGLCFVTWTGSSWLITGDLLAQFTSSSGNAAIIEASGGGATGINALIDASFRTFLISPMLPVLVLVVIFLSLRRRDPEPIIPMVMMGSVIVFQILTFAMGSTFGLLRFFIIAIPLTFVLLFQLNPPSRPLPSLRPGAWYRDRSFKTSFPAAITITGFIAVLLGTFITAVGMTSPHWAPQEFALQGYVQRAIPGLKEGNLAEQEQQNRVLRTFSTEVVVAKHLDAMGLRPGEVLVSTTYGFAVLTASENQKQFVIPSDRDFITSLNNPSENGVRYFLTIAPEGRGANDPINLRYPGIYDTGSHIATLELEFPNQGEGQPDWRLYRVLSHPVVPKESDTP